MKNRMFCLLPMLLLAVFFLSSCESEEILEQEPMLIVKFNFDALQPRLDNLGNPTSLRAGRAAQSPVFNSVSAHYIEFAASAHTQLGQGAIVYHGAETTQGGATAVDFSHAIIAAPGETFVKIPLRNLAAGQYKWLRVSLTYQNYGIKVRHDNQDFDGTLASFVGFNTFISSHAIGNNFFDIYANKSQGYWAFALDEYPYSVQGQAGAGATTVPNPLASTSPVPPGSCVVTGKFDRDLVVSGNEDKDLVVTLSLSVNHSFEWNEMNADGKFEPSIGETVTDMGLRGLLPRYQWTD